MDRKDVYVYLQRNEESTRRSIFQDKRVFADMLKYGCRYGITIHTHKGVNYYQRIQFVDGDTGRVLEGDVLAPSRGVLQPVFSAFRKRHGINVRGYDFKSGGDDVMNYTTTAETLCVEQGVAQTGTVSIAVVRMTEAWIIVRPTHPARTFEVIVREPSA